jgi:uncharacterized protein YdeI (YjbR/CyaY-like superfamily)
MQPVFFANPAELRRWLEKNHESAEELWVGLHKKETERPTITWPQLVGEVLCFGWIDGVRRSVGQGSYAIRITPRRQGSIWSRVNTRRAQELADLGLMTPSGRAAFERRDPARSGQYSFERDEAKLGKVYEAEFRANRVAWEFLQSQPPSYRKLAIRWVISAKREETRRRRLEALIEDSAKGRRIGPPRRGPNQE